VKNNVGRFTRKFIINSPFYIGLLLVLKNYSVLPTIEFWMLDDWTVVETAQNSNVSASAKILGTFNAQLNIYGDNARFTPIGWVITGLKNFFFQDQSMYWYLFNLLLVCISYIAAFGVLKQIQSRFGVNEMIAPSISLLFALYITFNPGVHDVFDRLGTPESITFTFSIVLLFMLVKTFNSQNVSIYWIMSNLVFILIVGSKENSIFFLPFMIFYGILLVVKIGYQLALIPIFISIGFTMWVIGGFLPFILNTSTDVYGNSRSANGLVTILSKSASSQYVHVGLILAGGLGIFILFFVKNYKVKAILFFHVFFLQLVVICNFLYFNGNIQANYRIMFYLCFWLLSLLTYVASLIMVGEKRISSRAFSTILIFLAVLAFSSWSGYSSEGIIKINQRAEITRTFHADIGRVVDAVEKGDSDGLKNQVIIFVKYGFDFESVRSTIVYLKNETKEAEYFLRFEDNPESGFPQTLKNELFRFAREGNQEWGISPNAKFSYRQNSIVNNVCVFWEPLLESPRDCSANILVRWRS
jgi:hypothetical protein